MKPQWIIIGSLFLGSSVPAFAAPTKAAQPDIEDSSHETDKKAAHEASTAADTWKPKNEKPEQKMERESLPGVKPSNPPAEDAPKTPLKESVLPQEEKIGVLTPTVPRIGLNEMRGKLLSKNYDPRTVRLSVAGGFNVEFTYDPKTVFLSEGKVISIEDLSYNDELVLRYIGKELYAFEIERVAKAPRPE